jgi:hypothetical protein
MEKSTIELFDGTKIENLKVNGNNYIADKVLSSSIFAPENLVNVKIDGVEHTNMVLVQNMTVDGVSWFILRDRTDQEIKEIEINAKIDYLMTLQGGTAA